jgi:hypothetical protein
MPPGRRHPPNQEAVEFQRGHVFTLHIFSELIAQEFINCEMRRRDPTGHYLTDQRRLPDSLLDPLVQTGRLYADPKANAVFLLLGKKNRPFLSNPLLTQWLHFSEHRWVHSSERHSLDHGSEEVTDMPATIPSIFSSF